MSKQDEEQAAAKQRKLDESFQEQEAAEAGEKAKQMPIWVPGKQEGKAKRQGRATAVAEETSAEGGVRLEDGGRVAEVPNGVLSPSALSEQKTSAGQVPSHLAFVKADAVSSPQDRNDGHMSLELEGPSLSDNMDLFLDSPWSGNGSGDTTHDGPSGSRVPPPCAGCTTLKAELDAVRKELKTTQGM